MFDETAFIFAYSPRQNTLASKYEDNISNTLKQQRLQKLLKLYHKILESKYAKLIGSKKEVLAENELCHFHLRRRKTQELSM